MARSRATRVVVTLALVGALAACTSSPEAVPSPSPSPSPAAAALVTGDRIAVIVPPASVVARAEGAALARAARDLAAAPPDGVADVRVVEAVSEAFVRDLANLAVDDGYDVVCVVGTGSAGLALELARTRRDARFCTTDGRIGGGPVNLVAVAPDPAVLVQAGAIAIGTSPAPVGLLLSPQLGDVEALTAVFTGAVAPPTQPSPPPAPASPPPAATPVPTPSASVAPPGPTAPQPPFVTATPGPASAAQLTAAEQLAAQRPSLVLVLATPGGTDAATAVGANGAAVVGVADWLVDGEGEAPPNLLVGLTVDWATLLRDAIAAAREEEPTQVQLRGAAVLRALPGPAAGATPAADRTTAFLEQPAG